MLTKAGTEGKQIVFLFSDNQIKDESFVEDINMILNTGDVPNLYPADEKADIIEKMQMIARTQVTLHIPSIEYTPYITSDLYHRHNPLIVVSRERRLKPHPSPCTTISLSV